MKMTAPNIAQHFAKYLTEMVRKALEGESGLRTMQTEDGGGVTIFVVPAAIGHQLDNMLAKMYTLRESGHRDL